MNERVIKKMSGKQISAMFAVIEAILLLQHLEENTAEFAN